jgi:hypothetical protein
VDQIGRLLPGQEGQAADDPLGEVLGLEGDRQRKGNDPAVFIKAAVIVRAEVVCRKAALNIYLILTQDFCDTYHTSKIKLASINIFKA